MDEPASKIVHCLGMSIPTDESERTKQNNSMEKVTYKKDFHTYQESYIQQYPNALRMRNLLPSLTNKSVLDVGCGSGIDMAYFLSQGAKTVAGADIAPELLTIAKDIIPNADIRDTSFNYLSWKEKTFDLVWSKYALNHADDIIIPLKEIERVLKDGGTAYIQVTHPFRTLGLLPSKDYFDDGVKISYPVVNGKEIVEPHHTIASWINAIHEAGFLIMHCEEILNRPKEEYEGTITPSAIIFVFKKQK